MFFWVCFCLFLSLSLLTKPPLLPIFVVVVVALYTLSLYIYIYTTTNDVTTNSVYIRHPQVFFSLFHDQAAQETSSSSALFLASKNKNNKTKSQRKQPPSSTNNKKRTLTEIAFAFLQWAQYGKLAEVPEFTIPTNQTTKTMTKKNDNRKTTPNDCHNSMNDNVKEDNNNDEDDDNDDDVMMKEEDFDIVETNHDNKNNKNALEVSTQQEQQNLPEMDDPCGFVTGISLRPYQRQALYWMRKREQKEQSQLELQKQWMLLSELTTTTRRRTCPVQEEQLDDHHHARQQDDEDKENPGTLLLWKTTRNQHVSCDCSPVLVTPQGKRTARTLDGQLLYSTRHHCPEDEDRDEDDHQHDYLDDPDDHHPLWKTRYLTTCQRDTVYVFYVNELLGVATCQKPTPPKPCRGGILADDMYVLCFGFGGGAFLFFFVLFFCFRRIYMCVSCSVYILLLYFCCGAFFSLSLSHNF